VVREKQICVVRVKHTCGAREANVWCESSKCVVLEKQMCVVRVKHTCGAREANVWSERSKCVCE
jgi:hypothetical protein